MSKESTSKQSTRLVVHDHTAFSFPVQLSRELAGRGYEVLHLYSDLDPRGGRLSKEAADPATFQVEAVSIGEAFQKYNFVKRWQQESHYGKVVAKRMLEFKPSIVFNSNAPIPVSQQLQQQAQRHGSRYIHWTQDIHSLAVKAVLPKKYGFLGVLGTNYIHRLECGIVNKADGAIVISDDFKTAFADLGIHPKRAYTIPNWMPLDEMKPENKVNPWSQRHGLDKTLNIMYVGTLSFKHDHQLFVELARHFVSRPDVRIVVVGAGIALENLKAAKETQTLDNLILLGWQKYEDIAYVLATGDILMSAIAPDASHYSVPSKVLSYLSAGRPVLAAIPPENLSHRLLIENKMGLGAHPNDIPNVIKAAEQLVSSSELRETLAKNGRRYAEQTFDIHKIADKFEVIISDVLSKTTAP